MGLKRRVFSKEFKLQILREVHAGKRPAEVAREYQILPKLISRWRSEYETYAEESFAGAGHRYTEPAQAAALARKLARLQEENELLKKALRGLGACPSPGCEPGGSR